MQSGFPGADLMQWVQATAAICRGHIRHTIKDFDGPGWVLEPSPCLNHDLWDEGIARITPPLHPPHPPRFALPQGRNPTNPGSDIFRAGVRPVLAVGQVHLNAGNGAGFA